MLLQSIGCNVLVYNVAVGDSTNLVEVLLFSAGDIDLGFSLVIRLEYLEGG